MTYELELDLDRILTSDELSRIEQQFIDWPVSLASLSQDKAGTLRIRFYAPKSEGVAIWPLWAIIAIVAAIPVGILGWKLFTMEPEELILKYLLPIGAIGLGGYLLYREFTRR